MSGLWKLKFSFVIHVIGLHFTFDMIVESPVDGSAWMASRRAKQQQEDEESKRQQQEEAEQIKEEKNQRRKSQLQALKVCYCFLNANLLCCVVHSPYNKYWIYLCLFLNIKAAVKTLDESNSSIPTSSLQQAAMTAGGSITSGGSFRRNSHSSQPSQPQQPIQILKKKPVMEERIKGVKKHHPPDESDAHSHGSAETHETHESASSLKRAVAKSGGTIPYTTTSLTAAAGSSSPTVGRGGRGTRSAGPKRDATKTVVQHHPAGHPVEYRFTIGGDDSNNNNDDNTATTTIPSQTKTTQGTLQPNGTVRLSRRRSSNASSNSAGGGGGRHAGSKPHAQSSLAAAATTIKSGRGDRAGGSGSGSGRGGRGGRGRSGGRGRGRDSYFGGGGGSKTSHNRGGRGTTSHDSHGPEEW